MIKYTKDYNLIKRMLFGDSELNDRITSDYGDNKSFNPDNYMWIGWFEGKTCHGLGQIEKENAITLIVHINILKKYRNNSFEIGSGLLKYLESTCNKRYVKLNAKVPKMYPDVVRFSEKLGFIQEGVDRQSYCKNGITQDRIILGKIIER